MVSMTRFCTKKQNCVAIVCILRGFSITLWINRFFSLLFAYLDFSPHSVILSSVISEVHQNASISSGCSGWWIDGAFALADKWGLRSFFIYIYPLTVIRSLILSPFLTCMLSLWCAQVKRWASGSPPSHFVCWTTYWSGFLSGFQPTHEWGASQQSDRYGRCLQTDGLSECSSPRNLQRVPQS